MVIFKDQTLSFGNINKHHYRYYGLEIVLSTWLGGIAIIWELIGACGIALYTCFSKDMFTCKSYDLNPHLIVVAGKLTRIYSSALVFNVDSHH